MKISDFLNRSCFVAVNTTLMLMLVPAVGADLLAGQATVIDGDTIEIRGQRVRLSGMDAFEAGQTCRDAANGTYRCGSEAAFTLDDFNGERNVNCAPNGRSWERLVAVCFVDGEDLGGWMVRQGHAVDDDRYQPSYWWAETIARWEGEGAWSGLFERPRAWREQRR